MSLESPARFLPARITRVINAHRFSKTMIWDVVTTDGEEFRCIANSAHDARNQINEMLQRIGSNARGCVVSHHPVTERLAQ